MGADMESLWRGKRGEWYVVLQFILFAVVVLGPRNLAGLPPWPEVLARYSWLPGGALMGAGALLSVLAAFRLGPNLTPLPHPRDDSSLVVSGAYGLVRHPIYSGLILMAVGWAVFVQGWLTLAYAALLFIFFDIKSRKEESWLLQKFPGYAEYRKRVRKLVPFIY